jgi:hypothetical protein
MRLITTILLCALLLNGCGGTTGKIPTGNQGNAQQKETESTKIIGEMDGEIELPSTEPQFNSKGENIPLKVRIDGVDMEVPSGTKGKIKVKTRGNTSSDSFMNITSSWKLNSAPVQLFVFGGILVAVGVALMFFGIWKIGLGCVAAGLSLIGCGVLINSYPWIVLIVLGIGLIIGAYYIFVEYKKHKALNSVDKQDYVLTRLVNLIARLPDETQEKYFKQPLREDDKSEVVREITKKARGVK